MVRPQPTTRVVGSTRPVCSDAMTLADRRAVVATMTTCSRVANNSSEPHCRPRLTHAGDERCGTESSPHTVRVSDGICSLLERNTDEVTGQGLRDRTGAGCTGRCAAPATGCERLDIGCEHAASVRIAAG